jgi:fatty acid/phospholipid biosynthesis enzyme
VAAHAALRENPGELNFVGNVEGFAIGAGAADVIVADGFTGNVALKVMEGTSAALLGAVRGAAMSSARAKLGGMLLRPALRGLRDEIDPEEQGCAGSASCRTGRSARAASRGRSTWRRAACGSTWPAGPTIALRERGR